MPPPVTCWNCGNNSEQIHFCDACHSLQPPASDYFDFFGMERRLHLDLAELERRYYTLSRRLHPDVYFRRSARERQFSLDATAILNDAYRTLRDPISRAGYLLACEGCTPDGNRVPPEVLEEVFEWNEAMEEADPAGLAGARARFSEMLAATDADLEQSFRDYDAAPGRRPLERVRALVDRRRYIQKLLKD